MLIVVIMYLLERGEKCRLMMLREIIIHSSALSEERALQVVEPARPIALVDQKQDTEVALKADTLVFSLEGKKDR